MTVFSEESVSFKWILSIETIRSCNVDSIVYSRGWPCTGSVATPLEAARIHQIIGLLWEFSYRDFSSFRSFSVEIRGSWKLIRVRCDRLHNEIWFVGFGNCWNDGFAMWSWDLRNPWRGFCSKFAFYGVFFLVGVTFCRLCFEMQLFVL